MASTNGLGNLNPAVQIESGPCRHPGVGTRRARPPAWQWCAVLLVLVGLPGTANAWQFSLPAPPSQAAIAVDAAEITHWKDGPFEILHLRGQVTVAQGGMRATSDQGIAWVEIPATDAASNGEAAAHQVKVYLQGQVRVEYPSADGSGAPGPVVVDDAWVGHLTTTATVDLSRATVPLQGEPPGLFAQAQQALTQGASSTALAGFQQPASQGWQENADWQSEPTSPPATPSMVVNPLTGQLQAVGNQDPLPLQLEAPGSLGGEGQREDTYKPSPQMGMPSSTGARIEFSGRDPSIDLNLRNFVNPNNPNERVSISVGGIRLAIDSPAIANLQAFAGDQDSKLHILADSMVHWELTLPDGQRRNQFYLEGNIVFAKGSRVIYAERMFYDVEARQGTILKAEVLTTVNNFEGTVRLKADVVRQLDAGQMQAFGSAVTSSRMGVPRYWLQSESLLIQQTGEGTGDTLVFDPAASPSAAELGVSDGSPVDDQYELDSRQNRVYVGGVPIFAWPRLRTDLDDPTLYLEKLGIKNDRIFGFQVTTGWNLDQILGLKSPPGTRWIGNLDYLSDRGVGFGSEMDYRRDSLWGIPGEVQGRYDSWFIHDDGLDFLGRDRRDLTPEETRRGRILWQHQQEFQPGYKLQAELGYISDRNFLEQYFEREWDTGKDATTGFWLQRNVGTDSYHLLGDLQLNEFFTQTSGIRFDHLKLGYPIFNHRAIWHSHFQAGYLRMRQADPPLDPVDAAKFDPLAWETDVDGFRVGSRQEIDFPLQIGPVKVVPYLLGDLSYWQEALDGNDLARAYGQAGVRASLPMWRVDPSIQSVLWNVNGLAHKVTFDMDAFYADASQDLTELPLYDPLDDDSQEHFRRRFAFDTFGIVPGQNTPYRFDERSYALRSGMQGLITAPSSEIADDLSLVRLGVRQRWQTKRGLPGRERIVDWVTLDLQTTLFPNAAEDNFNSDFGMFDYDFRWYVGDRLSLVSDGYFDFFSQGLRTASFGANLGRPTIGNAYLGYRMIEGPISSNILSAALTYRMSDKWGVKAGGQLDFGQTGTIGQTLSLIYIGESFLWQFGFNYDYSRENLGFRFGFEPRFSPRPRMFRPGGSAIPPAGARWLE